MGECDFLRIYPDDGVVRGRLCFQARYEVRKCLILELRSQTGGSEGSMGGRKDGRDEEALKVARKRGGGEVRSTVADGITVSRPGPSRRPAGGSRRKASWPTRMSRRTKLDRRLGTTSESNVSQGIEDATAG